MTSKTSTWMGAACALGLVACAAGVEDEYSDSQVGVQPVLLAQTQVNGRSAQFFAIGEELSWVQIARVEGEPDPLLDPSVRGLNFAEVYEYWSGDQAPATLQDRARWTVMSPTSGDLEALETQDEAEAPLAAFDPGSNLSEDVGVAAAALSGSDFRNRFCGAGGFCWLDRTGDWTHDERAQRIEGHVNAVRGNLTLHFDKKRRPNGSWIHLGSISIASGQVGQFFADPQRVADRPLRLRLRDADGDLWHLNARWK